MKTLVLSRRTFLKSVYWTVAAIVADTGQRSTRDVYAQVGDTSEFDHSVRDDLDEYGPCLPDYSYLFQHDLRGWRPHQQHSSPRHAFKAMPV